jgi:hypothetical protein
MSTVGPVAPDAVETPTPEPELQAPTDAESVADHAAQFSPEAQKDAPPPPAPPALTPEQVRARDDAGRFAKERHRAKSQRASAEDVPRIKELTAKWREAERQLAELRQQPAALQTPANPQAPRHIPTPSGFTKPEPTIEQFNNDPDPLKSWALELGRWDRERERFEETHAQRAAQTQGAERQASEAYQQWVGELQTSYNAKEQAFQQRTPNYRATVDAITTPTTPLLHQALLMSDNGPELVYYLATHPSLYDEMLLLTEGKPITEQTVALTQRQLAARSQAAQTGSATVALPVRSLPKPPNPVRTGPLAASETLPTETSSIADHKRYFGVDRR